MIWRLFTMKYYRTTKKKVFVGSNILNLLQLCKQMLYRIIKIIQKGMIKTPKIASL